MKQHEAVVILGMHRSGTSAMAGVATALGAAPPNDLLPAKPDNPKGFWESEAVMRLNDHVLAVVGSTWSDWRAINPAVFSSAPVRSLADRAAELIDTSFAGESLIVFKDPRVSRLLPFWRQALRLRDYVPRSVVMVRSPVEVASSLQTRNGFSLEHGMLLWLRYSLDAELQSRGLHRCVVMWSDLHANWRREVARVSAQTGLNWPDLSDAGAASIDGFLSRDLYHHRSLDADLLSDPRVHALVARAYTALSELAREPQTNAVTAELDEVRRAFDEADKLFGLILAQKDVGLSEAEARFSAAAQEVAVQTSLLLTSEGARSEAEASLRGLQVAEAELTGELVEVRAELSRRSGELQAAEGVIASLTVDLGALNERHSNAAAELDDIRLRGAALEDELASVVGERDRGAIRIADLERQIASADCEISTLRARIEAFVLELAEATQLRDHQAARSRDLEQELGVAATLAGDHAEAMQALSARVALMKAETDRAAEQHSVAVRDLADQRRRAEEMESVLAEAQGVAASERRDRTAEREHADSQLSDARAELGRLEEARRQAVLESQVHDLRAAAALRRLAIIEAGWLFRLQGWLRGRTG